MIINWRKIMYINYELNGILGIAKLSIYHRFSSFPFNFIMEKQKKIIKLIKFIYFM